MAARNDIISKESLLLAAGIVGAGAMAYGLSKMLSDSATGNGGDDAPGRTARHGSFGGYSVSGQTETINRPRAELYAMWRDFSRLPEFMDNVNRIEPRGDGVSAWTIRAPGGTTVEVVTRIARDVDGEVIAWESTPESAIDTKGRVEFADAPAGRGTAVTLIVAYKPPGGTLGKVAAKVLQREPALQARRDLRRFKMLMETGEISTSVRRREDNKEATPANAPEPAPSPAFPA